MKLKDFKEELEKIRSSRKDNLNLPLCGSINGKILPIVSFTLQHEYQPNLFTGDYSDKAITLKDTLLGCFYIENYVKVSGHIILPVCLDWRIVSTVTETYLYGNKQRYIIIN